MMNNGNPDISVIMAVYNSEQFLVESLESILNQSFYNFELIIIYDKSADNSKDIIKRYMKTDNRIILIQNEVKNGVSAARNKGLEKARGRYIAIMDSDDIALPNRLEIEYSFLENNIDYFLVGSNAIKIDEKGNILEKLKSDSDISLITNKNPIIHTSVMFRNNKIMYREKFYVAEDYDFYLRLLSSGLKIININEDLVKLRMRHSSISWNNITKAKLFGEKAQQFYYQRLETGTDEYDKFDEKEIMRVPNDDSRDIYLKYMISYSLKNEIQKKQRSTLKNIKIKLILQKE